MYQVSSDVYLDKYNECYKKVIVIRPAPQDDILKITKLVNTEKLFHFKINHLVVQKIDVNILFAILFILITVIVIFFV